MAPLRLGAGCRGFTSAEPDVIVRLSDGASFLRMFVRSSADLTLVVADPGGRFYCNDDIMPGRNTNPMIDVHSPRAGQYDVWIGTHNARESAEAELFVSASRDHRP